MYNFISKGFLLKNDYWYYWLTIILFASKLTISTSRLLKLFKKCILSKYVLFNIQVPDKGSCPGADPGAGKSKPGLDYPENQSFDAHKAVASIYSRYNQYKH